MWYHDYCYNVRWQSERIERIRRWHGRSGATLRQLLKEVSLWWGAEKWSSNYRGLWDKGRIWGDARVHLYAFRPIQERREIIAEEQITEKKIWQATGMDSEPKWRIWVGRRHTLMLEGLYTWVKKMRCLPSFPLISTFTSLGVKSQSISQSCLLSLHYWGGQRRVEKAAQRGGGCDPGWRRTNLLDGATQLMSEKAATRIQLAPSRVLFHYHITT